MTRVRQWLLGLASSSAFYSGVVPALGLGEITLHSALNQPLEAEIELLQVADLTASDLSVRLAPADVFKRSGVDRLLFLNDLRFTPLLRGNTSVIRVVSNQPVREPYLNFIVEVARPNGQLLREYTVLLDPPGSSAYRALASVPTLQAAPLRPGRVTVSAPESTPVAGLGQRYQVIPGDSLWKIAARLRGAGSRVSQQVLMRDIQALNPQAFSDGDGNRLRAGADLLLPDSAVAAVAPVEVPAVSAATQSRADTPAAPAAPPLDPPIAMITQAQQQVDQQLDEQTTENTQLQQGLAELQAQMQQLQQQMADKDRQLAELRDALAVRDTPPQALQAAAESSVAPPSQVPASVAEGGWARWGYAALALLFAATVGLLWRARRQVEPAAPADRQAAPKELPVAARTTPPVPAPVSAPAPAPRVAREPAPLFKAPQSAPPMTPGDALEGANIYIAYGRFGEAAAALRKALQAEPQRSDIRFRLLEVLAQLGDAQAFAGEEALLREAGFGSVRIDQLKARHPQLSAAPAADLLEDAVLDLDQVAQQSSAEALVEDDFQLNLDDLSLDADWDLVSPFAAGTSKKPTPERQGEIDSAPEEWPAELELGSERDPRNPFVESMLVEETSADGWLDGELHEAFGAQPAVPAEVVSDDLDRLAGSRDNLVRLNLALAYIEQGNLGGACDILNQVISEGDDQQRREARKLLAKIA